VTAFTKAEKKAKKNELLAELNRVVSEIEKLSRSQKINRHLNK
jgi:hypothetical protein